MCYPSGKVYNTDLPDKGHRKSEKKIYKAHKVLVFYQTFYT